MPWYYRKRDLVRGPISSDELRRLALRGAISPDSLVSRDQHEWVRAVRVKGLAFGADDGLEIFPEGGGPRTVATIELRCPKCKSEQVQKVSMIVEAGTTDTRSRGGAVALTGGGLVPVITQSMAKGQTLLAQRFSPPELRRHRLHGLDQLLMWGLGCMVIVFGLTVIGLLAKLSVARSLRADISGNVAYVLLSGLVLAGFVWGWWHYGEEILKAKRDAADDLTARRDEWRRTFVCHRCGVKFVR